MTTEPAYGYAELTYGPKWSYVSTIRDFTKNFCLGSSLPQRISEKAMIACSELLENAVKYCTAGEIFYRLAILPQEKRLQISIRNQTNQEKADILQDEIEKVHSLPPQEAYMQKLMQITTQTNSSQLGFARVRYETGADIKAKVEEEMVTMEVFIPFDV